MLSDDSMTAQLATRALSAPIKSPNRDMHGWRAQGLSPRMRAP